MTEREDDTQINMSFLTHATDTQLHTALCLLNRRRNAFMEVHDTRAAEQIGARMIEINREFEARRARQIQDGLKRAMQIEAEQLAIARRKT